MRIMVALLLTVAVANASLDKIDYGHKRKSVVADSLQERIKSRMTQTGHFYTPNSGNFVFVVQCDHPTSKFVHAIFCEPVPWFNWNEKLAIDHFISTAEQRYSPRGIMLVANPRIENINYRGKSCMSIVADITFVPEYARP